MPVEYESMEEEAQQEEEEDLIPLRSTSGRARWQPSPTPYSMIFQPLPFCGLLCYIAIPRLVLDGHSLPLAAWFQSDGIYLPSHLQRSGLVHRGRRPRWAAHTGMALPGIRLAEKSEACKSGSK